jgi:hypothetical protein
MKVIMYDPPGGWQSGFPKVYSPQIGESLSDVLKRDGYPDWQDKTSITHTRFWEIDDKEIDDKEQETIAADNARYYKAIT